MLWLSFSNCQKTEATSGLLFEYCSCIPSIPTHKRSKFLVHNKATFSIFASLSLILHAFTAISIDFHCVESLLWFSLLLLL